MGSQLASLSVMPVIPCRATPRKANVLTAQWLV